MRINHPKVSQFWSFMRRARFAKNERRRRRWTKAANVLERQIDRSLVAGLWRRETKPRSLRLCVDCGTFYRAVWIQPQRAYCQRCGECVLVAQIAQYPQETADLILTLFTPEELRDLRAMKSVRL